MKNIIGILAAATALLVATPSSAQDTLKGDEALACEALLCLSSSTRPAECGAALSRYFGIKPRKLSDLVEQRLNFLMLCPIGNWSDDMRGLADAISRGSGRCSADDLNTLLRYVGWNEREEISSQLPDFCKSYFGHSYTDLEQLKPRYVGQPRMGGRWVEAKEYEAAKERYDRYIQDLQDGRYPQVITIWW